MKPKLWTSKNKLSEKLKILQSDNYNYVFNYASGFFARWGATQEEDPQWSSYGPEIADIEITTSCNGPKNNGKNKLCSFCYKSNTVNGKYMSLETFKSLLNKFPHVTDKNGKKTFVISQIAFGVDAECKTNPDVWKIFEHCRDNDIVPNLTIATIDDEVAKNISHYCGACAVSRYSDKDACYDTIDLLNKSFGKQKIYVRKK